jgi:aminobenzoyl-glutamate utilization protein B
MSDDVKPAALTPAKKTAFDWIEKNRERLSTDHQTIWHLAETAWREYRSAAWYVERLRKAGFEVEAGSAGMPTAFVARWGSGKPVIASYAEYDAVPGNNQAPVPYRKLRGGLHEQAAGHTDPHSALGMGALGGILAAKAAMEKHKLKGTLVFFGEPAEKVCGSKPVHAAHGYYDGIDAAVSFHPAYFAAYSNTCVWDTHCGCYWSRIYTFECREPEKWNSMGAGASASPHTIARAPGAIDAVCLMYTTSKYTKEAMLPHTGTWTLNEAILVAGQATSDNLAPGISQIQYSGRAPTIAMVERMFAVLDANAEHVAAMTHCTVRKDWVTKTRPGLPNHAMAELTYSNLALSGPPQWGAEAKKFARELQRNVGVRPMEEPMDPAMASLIPPTRGEAIVRGSLPPWQLNYTSDDYTDWTWHMPTSRLYVGRPQLRPPRKGYSYPDWCWLALGGHPPAIDPTILTASRAISATLVDLVSAPGTLARARAEFVERTGGGIGGKKWLAPLLPKDFPAPIHFRWPEYVTTPRGTEWWIPTEPAQQKKAARPAAGKRARGPARQ